MQSAEHEKFQQSTHQRASINYPNFVTHKQTLDSPQIQTQDFLSMGSLYHFWIKQVHHE